MHKHGLFRMLLQVDKIQKTEFLAIFNKECQQEIFILKYKRLHQSFVNLFQCRNYPKDH